MKFCLPIGFSEGVKGISAMPRHIKYSKAQLKLASVARKKANTRDVLFHGTRFAQSILKMGVLFHSLSGDQKVCLTRSAEVAAYWALLDRPDDEGRASILIFDRRSLERRYKIEANPEVFWHGKALFHDEAEEEIWGNVVDVDTHLIGVVSGSVTRRPNKLNKLFGISRKELNRKTRTELEARLLKLAIPQDPNGRISRLTLAGQARSRRGSGRRIVKRGCKR